MVSTQDTLTPTQRSEVTPMQRSEVTPMLRQYLAIKEKHQDCILFFRLGDFYEMFFDDAVQASSILKITLTSRSRNEDSKIPMCGVPFHSATGYIQKLLDAGKKVAICEQMTDPETSKGIVEREVVRIVTPSLRLNYTSSSDPSYLAAVYVQKKSDVPIYSLMYVDISTGHCRAIELKGETELMNEFCRISPKELLWPSIYKEERVLQILRKLSPAWVVNFVGEEIQNDVSHPPHDDPATQSAGIQRSASMLFNYLKKTRYDSLSHIEKIETYEVQNTMRLSPSTIRNLELLERSYDREFEGSLFWLLDQTETAMGRRLLRHWILYPLLNVTEIEKRQDSVRKLFEKQSLRLDIKSHLKNRVDLERLLSRLVLDSSNARDLIALREILSHLPQLSSVLHELSLPFVPEPFPLFSELSSLLNGAICDAPPLTVREGGMICEGFNAELDELMSLMRDGKSYLADLESKEKLRTGINSLKVKYNQVFGYYIEITNTHLKSAPENYIRKQTLVNCERFITPELKEYENRILTAEEKRKKLEYELFQNLRTDVLKEIKGLLSLAHVLSELDATSALAEVASQNGWVCPEVTVGDLIEIKSGRHPVVEKISSERFVPNDVTLDDENLILMITGPNMAGKSTVMRQTALIVLLAQMGSFVPALHARIGVVDQIFTRVGAHDNMMSGDSTFMVEMKETAAILKNATVKSLILLDEIGRGTSTFDGMSIAWAVASYIHDEIRAKTLFATHYHELTELTRDKSRIKNFFISVREMNGDIVFLRKLLPGAMKRSYGIEVAKLADLPQAVLIQAKEVLDRLEKRGLTTAVKIKKDKETLSLFS